MDVKSELKSIQDRLGAIVRDAKAANRDLTAAEAKTIEDGSARALQLKEAIERGEKNAGLMDQVAALGADGGTVPMSGGRAIGAASYGSESGFITTAGLKAAITASLPLHQKSLVAGGSTVTSVSLDTKPEPSGQPGLALLNLLGVTRRETANYSFLRQSVRTNNADVVAEGGTKPTSVFTVAEVKSELQVIAHLSEPIPKYLLQDNRDLELFLTTELTNGVVSKIESMAVAAFLAASGAQTQAYSGSAADSIHLGASKVGELGYTPNLVLVNPADYNGIRLAKTADGAYLFSNQFDGTRLGLWGIATYMSADVPAGSAIVLDTSKVGVSIDRDGIVTEWNPYTGFATNTVLARTETRAAIDVVAPAAIAIVDLSAA